MSAMLGWLAGKREVPAAEPAPAVPKAEPQQRSYVRSGPTLTFTYDTGPPQGSGLSWFTYEVMPDGSFRVLSTKSRDKTERPRPALRGVRH